MIDIQEKILEYVNSKDIRDYLWEQMYIFDMKEAAWLVYQDKHHSLDEKMAMWEEIAITMEDTEFTGGACDALGSCKKIISKYQACIKKYRNVFNDKAAEGIYQFEISDYEENYHQLFSNLEECQKKIDSYELDEDDTYTITWQSFKYKNLVIRCTYNNKKTLKDIEVECFDWNREDYEIFTETFDLLWFKFPLPFKKGDIVIDCTRKNEHDGCATGVFVLDNVYTEEYAAERLKFGDNSDMTAWGYFMDEEGAVYAECMHAYMNLEYFKGKLTDDEKIFIAVSNYLKGEIGMELLLAAQRGQMQKANQNDKTLFFYTDEGLELAGLKENFAKDGKS